MMCKVDVKPKLPELDPVIPYQDRAELVLRSATLAPCYRRSMASVVIEFINVANGNCTLPIWSWSFLQSEDMSLLCLTLKRVKLHKPTLRNFEKELEPWKILYYIAEVYHILTWPLDKKHRKSEISRWKLCSRTSGIVQLVLFPQGTIWCHHSKQLLLVPSGQITRHLIHTPRHSVNNHQLP